MLIILESSTLKDDDERLPPLCRLSLRGTPQKPQRESRHNTTDRSDIADLLQRFQVCPFMFRERMGATSAVGRGHLPSKRPVYRYVFSCPGKAHAQVGQV